MAGHLLGIARRDRSRAPMEVIDRGEIVPGRGVVGDFRGSLKPGANAREVTVIAREDWQAAVDAIGQPDLPWFSRRANLLVEGIELPKREGARLCFSGGPILEVTGETDPCSRMEEIAPGLRDALAPDWRGGILTRVVAGGTIAIGDEVKVEE